MKQMFLVKPSVINGEGVFAKQDIPSGTRIAFFEYDLKRWHLHACVRFCTETKLIHVNNSYFKNHVRPNKQYDHSMYLYPDIDLMMSTSLATGYVLVGREYRPKSEPLAAGHLINDGAEPVFDKSENSLDFSKMFQIVETYRQLSATMKNAEIDDQFWFRATRDIAKGEEILTTYGAEFWLHRWLLTATKPLTRLKLFGITCVLVRGLANRPYDPFRCWEYDTETNKSFLLDLCGYKEDEIRHQHPVDFIGDIMETIDAENKRSQAAAAARSATEDGWGSVWSKEQATMLEKAQHRIIDAVGKQVQNTAIETIMTHAPDALSKFAAAKMRKQKKDEKRKKNQ